MNRKDYRKMMQKKKISKLYSRSLILAVLGLGVSISGNTIVKAESREWKANTSTTIKAGDTEYKIIWGDTLSLISKDSGITIETLTKLNNILDANLIYEGNTIYFGDGASVTVKDSSGNIIAETPLTEADKTGIKEAQQNDTNSTNSTTVSNVNKGNSSNNGSNTTNNSNSNSNSGNNNSNKPTTPSKPEKPSDKPENGDNGSETEKPNVKEYDVTVNHLTETGGVLSKETVKAKEGTTFEAKAKEFKGYELLSTDTQSVKVTEDKTITFIYKKVENNKPEVEKVNVTIKYLADDGKTLATETVKAEKGSTVKADAKDFTSLGYVLDDTLTKEVKAEKGATITFNYRKIVTPTPTEKFSVTTKYLDTEGNSIADNKVQEVEKGTTVTEEAISINGYKVKGNSTQSVVVNSNETITFIYEKEETPTIPTNEDKYITINKDVDGNDLGQNIDTTKYEEVSRDTKTSVETLENGNTITTYTTTIIWKLKESVPPVTPTTPLWPISGEQFGGRKTPLDEFINPANQATSNGYTFPSRESASAYGYANMEKAEFDPETTGKGFFMSSVEMKDGSVRWVVEWNYLIQ